MSARTTTGTDVALNDYQFLTKGVGTLEMEFSAVKLADETKLAVLKQGYYPIATNYNSAQSRDENVIGLIQRYMTRSFADNSQRRAFSHQELGEMTTGNFKEPPEAGKELYYLMTEKLKVIEETTKNDQEARIMTGLSMTQQQWRDISIDPYQIQSLLRIYWTKVERARQDAMGFFVQHVLLSGKPCAFLDATYLTKAFKGAKQTDTQSKVAKELFKSDATAPNLFAAAKKASGQFHSNLKNIRIYNVAMNNAHWDPGRTLADYEYRSLTDISDASKAKEYFRACFYDKNSDNKYTAVKGISRDECLASLYENLYSFIEQVTTRKLPTNSMKYDTMATSEASTTEILTRSRKEDLFVLMNPEDYVEWQLRHTAYTGPSSTRAAKEFNGIINGVECIPFAGFLPGHALVLTKYVLNIVFSLRETFSHFQKDTLVRQIYDHTWFWWGILTDFAGAYFVPNKFIASSYFYTTYGKFTTSE